MAEPTEPYREQMETFFAESTESFFGMLCSLHKTYTGKEISRIPVVGAHNLDLKKLFLAVQQRGGFNSVDKARKFKQVAKDMELPLKITNLGHTLKKYYTTLLAPVEKQLLATMARARRRQRLLAPPLFTAARPPSAPEEAPELPRHLEADIAVLLGILLPNVLDGIGASLTTTMELSSEGLRLAAARWPIPGIALVASRAQYMIPHLPPTVNALTLIVDTPLYSFRDAPFLANVAVVLPDSAEQLRLTSALSPSNSLLLPFFQTLRRSLSGLCSFHLDMPGAAGYLLQPGVAHSLNSLSRLKEIGIVDSFRELPLATLITTFPRLETLKVQLLAGPHTRLTSIGFGQVIPDVQWDAVATCRPSAPSVGAGVYQVGSKRAPPYPPVLSPLPKRPEPLGLNSFLPPLAASELTELVLIGLDGVFLADVASAAPRLERVALSHVHTEPRIPSGYPGALQFLSAFFPALAAASVFNPPCE